MKLRPEIKEKSQCDQLPDGLIVHYTSIAEVMGSNPVQAIPFRPDLFYFIFFFLVLSLNFTTVLVVCVTVMINQLFRATLPVLVVDRC